MIIWILLLITLSSSVCGTFVVTVKQRSYRAEENHNITLEWGFTTKPHSSDKSLSILCGLITDDHTNAKVLYIIYKGVEVPESEDEQFSGRVQADKDALREGRLRLHVSRLRTEDSGLYLCKVNTDHGGNMAECHLNVSVAVERPEQRPQRPGPEPQRPEPEPQRPEPEPQRPGPKSQGIISLYAGMGLTLIIPVIATVAVSVLLVKLCYASSRSTD